MTGEKRKKRLPAQQLLTTTRGQVLVLLCRRPQTVNDLAAHLKLTDNAVRAQLQRLQRDGYVGRSGSRRRGVRKPHDEYELTPQGHELFPRAYEPVLQSLIDVLSERLPPQRWRELLFEAGHRLLGRQAGKLRGRTPRQRLAQILHQLNGSGLGIELTEGAGRTLLRTCSCPVTSITAAHPQVCDVFAAVLAALLGVDVRQCCERSDDLQQCRFEILHAAKPAPPRPSIPPKRRN